MNDPCKCFLGDQICCALRGIPTLQTNYTAVLQDCTTRIRTGLYNSTTCDFRPDEKVIYIKAQLGCAIGMLVSCGLYVILCLFACFGVCFGHK